MFRYTEETLLLSVFVNSPEKRARIIEEAGALEEMEDPIVKGLIRKFGQVNGPEDVFVLKKFNPGTEAGELSGEEIALLTRVSIQPGFSPEEADGTISGCVKKIRLRGIEKRIGEAGKKGDLNLLKNLYRDKESIKGGDRTDEQRI